MPCRSYKKAVECLLRFRGAAKELQRARQFNEVLRGCATEYEGHKEHSSFWAAISENKVQLLTEEEAAGGAAASESREFTMMHANTQPAEG